MIYTRKIKALCHACKNEIITEMVFGKNKKHSDDFSIDCPKCENWEIGFLPTQNFDIVAEL